MIDITGLREDKRPQSSTIVHALLDRLEAAEKERESWKGLAKQFGNELDTMRAKIETDENDAAHQKALAASALRVAEGWERKCGELRGDRATLQQMVYSLKDRVEVAEKENDELRAKVAEMEKRLRLILEEPENTMSNSKAMREMIKQARLALEKSK